MKHFLPMYLVHLTLLSIAVSAESLPVKSQGNSNRYSHGRGDGSTSVSDVSSAVEKSQSDKCRRVFRVPSDSLYHGCGGCLPGYSEDVNNICTAVCSPNLNCGKDNREACTVETGGKCGPCLLPYVQIYDKCMSEPVVDHLIAKLQLYIDHMSGDGTPSEIPHFLLPDHKDSDTTTTEQSILPASSSNQGTDTDADLQKRMPAQLSNQQGESDDPQISKSPLQGNAGRTTVGFNNLVFFGIVSGATLLCIVCLIIAGICWYRYYKMRKSMQPADYVGYGGGYGGGDGSPNKDMSRSDSSGDRKLAQSAQMYHYQQVKQQMLALEKSENGKLDESDADDVEENEDGNYTVYECPGLAPAGEMEVSNPLFQAGGKTSPSSTPSSPPQISPPQKSSNEE